MAISRVGFVSLATGTNTGWTCAIPAGAAAGDVAYVAIHKAASAAPSTVPTGYVLLDPVDATGNSTAYIWCYAKVLQAGDPGTNHVWAWASTTGSGACLILRGCDTLQVLDVTDPPAGVTANSTSVFAPATTVSMGGSVVIWACALATSTTQSWPATLNGNTITRELGSASGGLGMAWATYPTAGAVSACQITSGVTSRSIAKTLVARMYFAAVAPARVTRVVTEALVQPTAQRVRVSQAYAEVLTQPPDTQRVRLTRMVVEALYPSDAPPAPTGIQPKRWDGAAWQATTTKRWDGTQWVTATVKRWNGTAWV